MEGRFPKDVETLFLPASQINAAAVRDADALVIRTRTKCNEELLKDSGVKLIVTATIGTDHIDIPWCKGAGVEVRNAPGCNAPGVAQYVFASLFKAGFDPRKHTLGIIGHGNVGSVVAMWAEKMKIKTIITDSPKMEAGFQDADYKTLDEVLKNSDAVTLHVPLTKTGLHPTFHMIGKRELDLMKNSSILINSSRGGVVDENELSGRPLSLVLDVWENEPDINPVLARSAFIATPHIAGYSAQGKMRASRMALQALNDYLGIPVILSGLDCKKASDIEVSKEIIENSYDPLLDSKSLLNDISKFEDLRNHYSFRNEP